MELTNPLAAQAVQADKARRQAELSNPESGQPNRDRGNRSVQDIKVQTFTQFSDPAAAEDPPSYASVSRGSSCKRSKESTPASEPTSAATDTAGSRSSLSRSASCAKDTAASSTVSFSSGNPFVEVTRGILHLYKENQTTSLEEGVLRSQMLCK